MRGQRVERRDGVSRCRGGGQPHHVQRYVHRTNTSEAHRGMSMIRRRDTMSLLPYEVLPPTLLACNLTPTSTKTSPANPKPQTPVSATRTSTWCTSPSTSPSPKTRPSNQNSKTTNSSKSSPPRSKTCTPNASGWRDKGMRLMRGWGRWRREWRLGDGGGCIRSCEEGALGGEGVAGGAKW